MSEVSHLLLQANMMTISFDYFPEASTISNERFYAQLEWMGVKVPTEKAGAFKRTDPCNAFAPVQQMSALIAWRLGVKRF